MSIRLASMVVRCPHCDVVKRCIGIEDDETKAALAVLMYQHIAESHPESEIRAESPGSSPETPRPT